MKPRLVIFDCDGVLIDSELINCGADASALTALGYPVDTADVVARFGGMGPGEMRAIVEKEMGRPLPKDFGKRVEAEVLARYRLDLEPMRGAADLLSAMVTPKAVASSSRPSKLALGLVETGLYEAVYPHIFSTALVARGKPHPDVFLYTAKQFNLPPEACLVIEDSVNGVRAGVAAGMRVLGFTGGSHTLPDHGARLTRAGAAELVTDLKHLIGRI